MKYSKSQIKKYEWSIVYIKEELATGRDLCSSFGSAGGFSYAIDRAQFADWCETQGESSFADLIRKECRIIKQ